MWKHRFSPKFLLDLFSIPSSLPQKKRFSSSTPPLLLLTKNADQRATRLIALL